MHNIMQNVMLQYTTYNTFECMRNGIFGKGSCNGTELGEVSFIVQGKWNEHLFLRRNEMEKQF